MSRSCNEELVTKIITDKLVLAHRHVGKPAAVKLVVNAIDIVRATVALAFELHLGSKEAIGLTYVHPCAQRLISLWEIDPRSHL